MHASLEFHDSEVRSTAAQADTLQIAFSAAWVRLAPDQAGYAQSLHIQCLGARWDGSLADCMGRLSGGRLLDGDSVLSSLALPYASTGPVRLELQFSNGTQLQIHAESLVCGFSGDPKFVESFAC